MLVVFVTGIHVDGGDGDASYDLVKNVHTTLQELSGIQQPTEEWVD